MSGNLTDFFAPAPGPFGNSSAPSPSEKANATDILGECAEGSITCYKNQVSDNQIITALWISCVVGATALLLFCLLRDKVKIYTTRLHLGSVWIRPPLIDRHGFHKYWSWLKPLIFTSDAELIHTAGLDALMLSWILSMGVQIFVPVAALGAAMLLPINLAGSRQVNNFQSSQARPASSTFGRLTVSNIGRGSRYYWVVFAFVYLVTGYICWVLIKYYQAYVILRQHYLVGGETLVNEWHLQFLAEKEAAEKEAKKEQPTIGRTAMNVLVNIFDPSNQLNELAGNMEDAASVFSAFPTPSHRVTVAGAMHHNRQQAAEKDNASVASGRKSHASDALRDRRWAERVSPRPKAGVSPTENSFRSFASQRHQPQPKTSRRQLAVDTSMSDQDGVSQRGPLTNETRADPVVPPLYQDMGSHRRAGSELTREVLAAAGLAPSHEALTEPGVDTSELLHEPGIMNPGGGGLRSHFKGMVKGRRSRHPSADAAAEIHEDHVSGRSPKHVPHESSFKSSKRSRFGKKSFEDSQDLIDQDMERSSSLQIVVDPSKDDEGSSGFCNNSRISQYERDAEDDSGREEIYQWWKEAEVTDAEVKMVSSGKPNVSFRKIINSINPDGTLNAFCVNAQSYAVLVTDVPDLRKEARRIKRRAARQRWAWRAWYRFAAWWKTSIFLRKDVHRKTGDFIVPASARAPRPPTDFPTADKSVRGHTTTEHATLTPVKEDVDHHSRTSSLHLALDDRKLSLRDSNDTETDSIKAVSGQPSQKMVIRTSSIGSEAQTVASGEDLVSPKSQSTMQTMDQEDEDIESVDSERLVRETFRALFPDSFDGVLPIRKHKAVDVLLAEWNTAWHKLQAAEQKFVAQGRLKRPEGRTRFCGLCGEKRDLIDYWAKEIRRLEVEIVKAKEAALTSPYRTSFFVFFTSQKDAAIAAQTKLHPEDGHSFQVQAAPGPEEVNWQTLWMSWSERETRGLITLIPLLILMLFPIGLFSGAVNQATVAICDGNTFLNVFYSEWYCRKSSLARSVVTGVLPAVLLMLWQNLVMPSAVYRIAQQQGSCFSLSSLDRRIGIIFFVWDIFNVFLGAMLGGSIFSQIGIVLKNPTEIASSIGTALPLASNFFVNYIVLQAFATQTVRMLLPHLGIVPDFFRLCNLCKPKSDLQKTEALSPHSIRYGREIGAIMLVYLIAMAYAAISPIILPFALLYVCIAWIHWRYNILYVSERCYESGGRAWDLAFTCMVWILFIFEAFTGAVLLANSAYPQAAILWITMTPLLYKFHAYCDKRYGNAVRQMPLETAATAPAASVPAVVYMPPALRKGAAGWYPEFGKAWENFGMPSYTL